MNEITKRYKRHEKFNSLFLIKIIINMCVMAMMMMMMMIDIFSLIYGNKLNVSIVKGFLYKVILLFVDFNLKIKKKKLTVETLFFFLLKFTFYK